MKILQPLRIGILGAARIAPNALIQPARVVDGAVVTAIAARDHERAAAFARKYSIPVVHDSYQALLEDGDIDVVYNPLPNALHGTWSVRAMAAGKHVLCEKPLAANADEAATMVAAAERSGRRLVEAFHYRYHRLVERVLEIIDSGEIGEVRHYRASFVVPIIRGGDIRYNYDLGGGATMDLGCYPIHLIRTLAGAEPVVIDASAVEGPAAVDRSMAANLRFADGRTANIECSMWSPKVLRMSARVEGTDGAIDILNPVAPQIYNRVRIENAAGRRAERIGGPGSYTAQLRAFVGALGDGRPLPTEGGDSIANMRVIDAIYQAAAMPLRQPVTTPN